MKNLRRLMAILVLALIEAWPSPAVAAVSWSQAGTIGDIPVSSVTISGENPREVVAVGGSLWLSHDGGLTWQSQAFAQGLPTVAAFDPARRGVLAIGTYNGCLMDSHDGGLTWTQHKIPFNYYCNVMQIVGTKAGFVFTTQNVVGYTQHLFRLNQDGSVVNLASFPDQNPGSVAYDEVSNHLCAGTTKEIYCSSDDGLTWQRAAAANQIGNYPHNLTFDHGNLWLLSDGGIFSNQSGSWQAVVPNNPVANGNPFAGLVVDGADVIFGDSIGNKGVVKFTTSIEPQGLGQMVNSLARTGDTLFAATQHGLYVTRDVVTSQAGILRPVIVLPGITGSLPSLNPSHFWQLELDPVEHTYDPLLARLRAVGYVDGQTLFPLPYNWEQPNEVSGDQLAAAIREVRQICSCDKVDIVAHSMGGLVARSYIVGPDYARDVNKLIEVGTPNAGSVNAYYTWEGGELIGGNSTYDHLLTDLESGLFHLQAYAEGYVSFTHFIHDKVTSVRQLLPIFNYIEGRQYPNGYPQNLFLEQLNAPATQALLAQRVKLRIIGGDTKDTLRELIVGDQNTEANFPDGVVTSVVYGPGDGTVPVNSLGAIARVDDYEDADHGKLPTVAQDTIVRYLLEDDVDQSYLDSVPGQVDKQAAVVQAEELARTTNYQLIYAVGGSGSLRATDASGRAVDQDSSEVPGAYYGIANDEQIITIPSPNDETYEISFHLNGEEDATIQIGGSYFDAASSDVPAGQQSVHLTSGQSVAAHLETNNQIITIDSITSPQPEIAARGEVAAVNTDQPGFGDVTALPDKLIDSKSHSLSVITRISPKTLPELLSAALPMHPSSDSVAPARLADSGAHIGWSDYGADFWLAVAVTLLLMLALGAWVVSSMI